MSAEDSALGRPVSTAAPRSATNSRWRDSASISTKESRYTATETSMTTMKAGWPPSRSRPPPRNGANWSTSAAMLAKKLATVMIEHVAVLDVGELVREHALELVGLEQAGAARS